MSNQKKLLRYLSTIRFLKSDQVYHRIKYLVERPSVAEPKVCPKVTPPSGLWVDPIPSPQSYFGNRKFIFFGRSHTLKGRASWDNADSEELWNWNMHYFDDLSAENSLVRYAQIEHLINDWIAENPTPHSLMAWDPYTISLRTVNWIKWGFRGAKIKDEWLRSLFTQLRFLRKRIEYDLYGNHLIANAKALCFAGCYFEGEEAKAWLRTSLSILDCELPEQILGDGGHFELSPMYHKIILEDILDLINLASAYPEQISLEFTRMLKVRARKMLLWMEAMEHPDKEISFFNDAAMGVASNSDSLKNYANRSGIDTSELKISSQVYMPDSGYFRWEKYGATLIGDVGRIGPDYIPGHGHADALSFEFSIGKQRVLVNSGTSLYEETKERLRQRGTSAHNTVEVDGENSSEVWKSFRVARRANPFGFQIKKQSEEWIQISCSHDGYRRLTGRNTHCRFWRLERGRLVVRDEIQGPFMSAVARFYLHPNIKITGNSLLLPNGITVQFTIEGGQFQFIEATWHPEFGKSTPTKCIVVKFLGPEIQSDFIWT